MLVYLNCHACIAFLTVYTLVSGLGLVTILLVLFVAGSWLLLVISIIIVYPITSDGCPMVEEAGDLPLGQLTSMGR